VNRRKSDLQSNDLARWPTVVSREFDPKAKRIFQTKMFAVHRYTNGPAIRGIELETGKNPRHLLERHPALSTWVGLQVKRRKLLLEQIHTDGTSRTRLSEPAAVLHESRQQLQAFSAVSLVGVC
jgi:putative transposase